MASHDGTPRTVEQALTDEFDGEVIFAPWLPPTITPPAVVVAPGRPFLVPSTHGGITETWSVMVAVSVKEPRLALSQIRGLGLRVRKAAQSVGAVWRDTDGPDPAGSTNMQVVVSVTEIAFRYLSEE